MLSRLHWVRPELVGEVKYLTWTDDNLLRQVVYEGLREEAGGRRGSPAGPALTTLSSRSWQGGSTPAHTISPLEGGGFELSVPGDGQSRCSRFCAARLLGMDRRTGAGVPRFSSIMMRGKPSTMPPHTRG